MIHEYSLYSWCNYQFQSGYFRGMLKGQWLESGQPFIAIEIPDESVDRKGIHFIARYIIDAKLMN